MWSPRPLLDKVIITVAAMLTAFPALAEEVLHCADTGSTGFKWDEKGQPSKTDFALERYTVKIGPVEGAIRLFSDNERIITQTSEGGGFQGIPYVYQCETNLGSIVCNSKFSNTQPWMFAGNHYVRAYLLGGPTGPLDRNIGIAYGTCTKF
jgi:hypothetical protein